MKKTRARLDVLLVARGFFETRAKAQAAVMAGKVKVGGQAAPKAGQAVAEDALIEIIADACPYVSRGGLKLQAALDAFGVSPAGRVCLDVGSSTGGFTDCLLQRGAARVYAVDVGTAQLDARLRAEARVVSRERLHARDLKPALFAPPPALAVIDVSFISLAQVLPFVLPCLSSPYEAIALIKPQFEVGPKKAPKGVVKNQQYRLEAVEKIRQAAAALPIEESGLVECPVHGPKGNVEFFIHWKSAIVTPA